MIYNIFSIFLHKILSANYLVYLVHGSNTLVNNHSIFYHYHDAKLIKLSKPNTAITKLDILLCHMLSLLELFSAVLPDLS